MPTYDYVCKKCRHRFEEVQPFSAEPVAACHKCGSASTRQFSVPVVVYKGSGFYSTDHGRGSSGRNGGPKKEDSSKEGSSDSSAPAKKDSAKSEVKSEPAASTSSKADKGD